MNTPTIYRWDDPGAPDLSTAVFGAAAHDGHRALLHLLKTCLVDGYGAKPGAGWTLVNNDTTLDAERMAFANANGSIFEVIAQGSYTSAFAYHESVTTWGVGNLDGTGASTGQNDDPTIWTQGVNSQCSRYKDYDDATGYIAGIYSRYMSSNHSTNDLTSGSGWILFATDKTFIFLSVSNPDYNSPTAPTAAIAGYAIFAGAVNHSLLSDTDPANFMFAGNAEGLKTGSLSSSQTAYIYQYLCSAKNPFGDDKLADEEIRLYNHANSFLQRNYHDPIFMHNGIPIWYTGAANPHASEEYIFATLPGVRKQLFSSDDLLVLKDQFVDGNTDRVYTDFVTFDGYTCFPTRLFSATANTYGCFISSNPAYWP